jgi:hypothetical protein|tara:strand:+ start:64 stop:381 length:318 start_codon:yes stop_codon:yes gene_type:complete
MAQELGSGTNVGVDVDGDGKPDFHLTLKSVAMIVAAVFTLGSMYVKLQMDIDDAKLLPPASIDRTEYDLKQQWFEDHIDDLEEDVKDLQQHVEKLSDKLANKKDR